MSEVTRQNKLYILSLFLFFGISACASNKVIYAPNDKPVSLENMKKRWSGKYRQTKGFYDLIIEQIDSDMIAVDIVRVQKPDSNPDETFLAIIKGDVASIKLLHDEPECKTELKHTSKGIIVSSFCGGTEKDDGLYERVQ